MATSMRIALVFDCDGTIAEDTTTRLIRYLGMKPKAFWADVRKREKEGWEPTLAFMHKLIEFAQENKKKRTITENTFQDVGRLVKLSRGIPGFFKEVKHFIQRKYGPKGVSLSIYIASGGIEDIIRASRINGRLGRNTYVDDIFACRFAYDSDGVICFPKSIVTFTEKTKLLFAINKGLTSSDLAEDPYCVNDQILPHDRPVPFQNMIYIGDGPTDVPCMSFLKGRAAEIFAVYTEPRQGIPQQTYVLARHGRFTRGPYPRDYRSESALRRALEAELQGLAERIIGEAAAGRHRGPRHG